MFEVQDVSKADTMLGGDMKKLMPKMEDIPKEFHRGHTPWNKVASKWFFSGLSKGTSFTPKEGVDGDGALLHLAAIQASFEPKHEHKSAAVSFLLSEWFTVITNPDGTVMAGN